MDVIDLNKVKVSAKPMTIGQIMQAIKDDRIVANAEFCNKTESWIAIKQSQFIESIILNLAVPNFCFCENKEGSFEVIDGLQRLEAIKRFMIDGDMKMEGLELLQSKYDGKTFLELPSAIQWRIESFVVTVYILAKESPDDVKRIMFDRLNIGRVTKNIS